MFKEPTFQLPKPFELLENSSLPPVEKMELVLVKAGLKPATELELFSDTWQAEKGEAGKKIPESRISEVKRVLGSLQLVYKISEPEIDYVTSVEKDIPVDQIKPEDEIHKEREKRVISLVMDKTNLETYLEAGRTNSDAELGRLFGYPATAIDAYLKGKDILYRKDLPEGIKKEDWTLFCYFGLSTDHWQEELEVVKKWAIAVKERSPKIYGEYVNYMKSVVNF